MAELHETRMGKTLIDSTFPRIAKELKRIADALELRNQADTLIRAKQEEEDLNSNPNSQLEKISDNILIGMEALISVLDSPNYNSMEKEEKDNGKS